MTHPTENIRVKLVNRGSTGTNSLWGLQCPGGQGKWGNCVFTFDPFERKYDWLVVVDDVPRLLPYQTESLACSPENTILVTSEPSSVTRYGKAFAAQFGHLLTNQSEQTLPHPNAIRTQTGNVWLYGKTYDQITRTSLPKKHRLFSTLCSSKQQAHTMHARRYDFTQRLKAELPELDVYGHGVRYVKHKYEALDPYRFHLIIENHIAPDVWTEKLADAFLGLTLPIYCGCPNVFDYFPKGSLIPIDINDFDGSLQIIQRLVSNPGEYERRLEAINEARRRVMEEYNLPAMLSRIIKKAEIEQVVTPNKKIYSRRIMRARHPKEFIHFAAWRGNNLIKQLGTSLRRNRDCTS